MYTNIAQRKIAKFCTSVPYQKARIVYTKRGTYYCEIPSHGMEIRVNKTRKRNPVLPGSKGCRFKLPLHILFISCRSGTRTVSLLVRVQYGEFGGFFLNFSLYVSDLRNVTKKYSMGTSRLQVRVRVWYIRYTGISPVYTGVSSYGYCNVVDFSVYCFRLIYPM